MLPDIITADDFPFIDRKNKTVVFTNGCFDLLHEGHIYLLREAKKLGSLLIVGLNTDNSVRRLKGESRPVENEKKRAEKIAALPEIDHVVLFDEDTPAALIEKLQPDVLVKGGDYTEETIVGAQTVKDRGGKVVIIPLLEGFSTTNILKNKPRTNNN